MQKAKAEREPAGDDAFIKKKWAKQAKERRRGAARIARVKVRRAAESKLKRLKRRAALNARGGPNIDENYQEIDLRDFM